MGTSLFEVDRGVRQLRIIPANSSPAHGSYVFCLGTDQLPAPLEDFNIGDMLSVTTNIDRTVFTPTLLRLQGRFRQPAAMPTTVALPQTVTVTRANRPTVANLSTITVGASFFTQAHVGRVIRLSGTGITAGLYRVIYLVNGTTAVLDGNPLASVGGPTTVDGDAKLVGVHWAFRAIFAGVTAFSYAIGLDGGRQRDVLLPDIIINVARHFSVEQLTLELELMESP